MNRDAIVLGGGPDGLVCAARLAGAGLSVLVLEAGESTGGAAVTEELGEGIRVPVLWPSAETLAPEVAGELALEAHGLEWLPAGGPASVATAEGLVPLTVEGLEARAPGDGRALEQLRELLGRLDGALGPLLREPLPELEDPGARDGLALLGTGWRLRRLGRDGMYEALRFLPMPVRDVVQERFADPVARAAVAGRALTGSPLGPWGAGTAVGLLWHALPWLEGTVAGLGAPRFVHGGPGGLSNALAAAARAAGAEIRTGAAVETILVREGRVAGVALAGGEEIGAGTVASTLHPATTLERLLEPGWLEPEEAAAVAGVRGRGSVAAVAFVLEELPAATVAGSRGSGASGPSATADDPAGALLSGRIQVGDSLEALERAADDAKHGRLPRRPVVDLTFPSAADPSLVPDGRHVAHAWVHHVPADPQPESRGPGAAVGSRRVTGAGNGVGGADAGEEGRARPGAPSARDALGDAVLRALDEALPGFANRVTRRHVLMPRDLERRHGVVDGAPYQVDMTLDQMLFLRPYRGASSQRCPVGGLYLCGPGSHPGGGLSGLPGRNGARRIVADRRRRS